MKKYLLALIVGLFFVSPVAASPHTFSFYYLENDRPVAKKVVYKKKIVKRKVVASKRHRRNVEVASASVPSGRHGAGARPGKWCGWYMRTKFGGGPEYNRARLWANRGVSAGGPQVGAVVVWPHHVGLIVGRASNGRWLVHSGNDSNRVRTRPRSVAGAIAFRKL